jgi:hypothetical protein
VSQVLADILFKCGEGKHGLILLDVNLAIETVLLLTDFCFCVK